MKALNWEILARLVAQSKTKIELEFAIVAELEKIGVPEHSFWKLVKHFEELSYGI